MSPFILTYANYNNYPPTNQYGWPTWTGESLWRYPAYVSYPFTLGSYTYPYRYPYLYPYGNILR